MKLRTTWGVSTRGRRPCFAAQMHLRALIATSAVAVCVIACGGESGEGLLDAVRADSGDAATALLDGSSTSRSDAGSDVDAKDASPPCVKARTDAVELCDDGIDNDCNGLTDCADPACGAFACTDAAPSGWDLIAFLESAQPACPAGFVAPTDMRVLNGSATHTCPCSCTGSGGSGPTCDGASSAIGIDDENTCSSAAVRTVASAAACTAIPGGSVTIAGGGSSTFAMLGSPAGPASCSLSASTVKTDLSSGRLCVPPAKLGGGCGSAMVCLPTPTGYPMCISRSGDQPCPNGFKSKRFRIGPNVVDTRSCSECTCGAPAPCSGEVTLWSNATCSSKSAKLTTAGNTRCNPPAAGGDENFTATHYKSMITGGCSVATPPVAEGGLAFVGEQTVCCK